MTLAWVAWLGFLRDRGALFLAFALPPIVFLVFASVFAAGVSGKLDLRIVVTDEIASPESRAIVKALGGRLSGRFQAVRSVAEAERVLSLDGADAGVRLRGDLRRDPAPVTILSTAAKHAAAEVAAADMLGATQAAVPHLMLDRAAQRLDGLVRFTPQQKGAMAAAPVSPDAPADFVARRTVGAGGDPQVVYYAAGVSILFLMFAAMQSAMAAIDERRTGIAQRLALSPLGSLRIVGGRALWMIALGMLQSLVVFAVAALVYGAPVARHPLAFGATALFTAAAATGVCLALGSLCRTREQAQTVSTFVILILGAVGGSMAPRFLMPAAMQALGWATPNSWSIEAYQGVLWRGAVDQPVFAAWAAMAAFAVVGFVISVSLEARRRL